MAARAQKKLKEKEEESRRPKPRPSERGGLVAPIPPVGAPRDWQGPPRVPGTPITGQFANAEPITVPRVNPRANIGPTVQIPATPGGTTPPPPAAARAGPLPPMNPDLLRIAQQRGIPISGQIAQAQPISISAPARPPIRALPPATTGMEPPIPPLPMAPGPNPQRYPTMGSSPGPTMPGEPTVGAPPPASIAPPAGPTSSAPTLSQALPIGLPPTSPGQAPLLQNTIAPIVRNPQPAGMTPTTFDTGGMPPNPAPGPGPMGNANQPLDDIIVGPQRVATPGGMPMEELPPIPPAFLQQMGIRQQAPIPPQQVPGSRIRR